VAESGDAVSTLAVVLQRIDVVLACDVGAHMSSTLYLDAFRPGVARPLTADELQTWQLKGILSQNTGEWGEEWLRSLRELTPSTRRYTGGVIDLQDARLGLPPGRSWRTGQHRKAAKRSSPVPLPWPRVDTWELIQRPLMALYMAQTEVISSKSIEVILQAYRQLRAWLEPKARRRYVPVRELRRRLEGCLGWVFHVRWD
jgi:hypothetical protein